MSLSEQTEPDPLLGVTLGGEYTLVRLIGQGGMGKVYEAQRTGSLRQRRAIKVFQEGDLARFNREAEVAIQRDHPNIVRVDDIKLDAATQATYIVMELLKGESLRERLAKAKRLTLQQTLDILLPVMDALAVMHDNGVVHRDLSPANIFLHRFSDKGDEEVPKLLDFGLAKVIRSRPGARSPRTTSQAFMGTPGYAAPVTSSSVDARADQFSLGVILYECVVGTNPLVTTADGTSTGTRLMSYLSRAACADKSLSNADVPVPVEFFDVVRRMVSFSQKGQYAHVREAARALAGVAGCSGEPPLVENPATQLPISEPINAPALAVSSSSTTPAPIPAQGMKWSASSAASALALLVAAAAFASWVAGSREGSEPSAAPSPIANAHSTPGHDVASVPQLGSAEPEVAATQATTAAGVAIDGDRITAHGGESARAPKIRKKANHDALSSVASPTTPTSSALEKAFEQIEKAAKANRDAKRRNTE